MSTNGRCGWACVRSPTSPATICSAAPARDTVTPNRLDAWQAAALLARRELSAVELAHACLERVAERDAEVHAFVTIDPDAVLAQARALDAGPIRGLLHGLPLGVKDLVDSAELPT